MQAVCMPAYSGGTLDQAGCYSGAQLYEQKSAAALREASFSASTQRGTLEHLNRHHKKHTPSLKQGFACARHDKKTKNPPEKLFTFYQCFTETKLPWDVLWFNLEFISCGLGRALNAHVVLGNKRTKSFRKPFPTLNLLLEFPSCKQHFLWRSSHWQYKSAVSQAEDGSSSENSAHRWAQSPKPITLFGGT